MIDISSVFLNLYALDIFCSVATTFSNRIGKYVNDGIKSYQNDNIVFAPDYKVANKLTETYSQHRKVHSFLSKVFYCQCWSIQKN